MHQGAKPKYFYIMLKGLTKIYKRPNRTEMIVEKLELTKEKAERHDLKYVYSHNLRHQLSKAEVEEKDSHLLETNHYMTEPEYIRYKLQCGNKIFLVMNINIIDIILLLVL